MDLSVSICLFSSERNTHHKAEAEFCWTQTLILTIRLYLILKLPEIFSLQMVANYHLLFLFNMQDSMIDSMINSQ